MLVTDGGARSITLAGTFGGGKVVISDQDPDFHFTFGNVNQQVQLVQNAINWVAIPATITVTIDIKPGSNPNSINCKNQNGVIPVAILTTTSFDAQTVDASTVRFGQTGTEASETHNKGHIEDADGDGDLDMVLHFRFGDTGIQCGDTQAILSRQTTDGKQITGSDAIQTVGV